MINKVGNGKNPYFRSIRATFEYIVSTLEYIGHSRGEALPGQMKCIKKGVYILLKYT